MPKFVCIIYKKPSTWLNITDLRQTIIVQEGHRPFITAFCS